MKKIAAASLLAASAAFAAPAMATTDSHFSIGFVAQALEYEEEDPATLSESTLQGLEIRFFDRRGYWHGALDFRIMGGTGDYDGVSRANPGGGGLIEDTNEFLYEAEYRLGHHATSWAAPFAGIGYRRWEHNIDGANGYDRKLEYLYSPVGVQFDGAAGGRFFWSLYAAYNFLWDGTIESSFNQADDLATPPGGNASNGLSGGGGFDISLMLSYQLDTGATVGLRPYMRYWNIDNSDTRSDNTEPEHEITSVGGTLFLTF